MFCSKCGNPNDNGAIFCNACGERLDNSNNVDAQNDNVGETVAQESFFNKNKKYLIGACAFIFAVGIFVTLFSSNNKPDDVATNYIKAIAKNDYKTAYKYLEIKESDFITEKNFATAMEWTKNYKGELTSTNYNKIFNYYGLLNGEVVDLHLKKVRIGENEIEYDVITNVKDGNVSNKTVVPITVILEKSGFFESYKIKDENILDKVIYGLPKGTVLKIDGINVEPKEKYIDNNVIIEGVEFVPPEKNIYDTYVIENIFHGKHKVEIEHPVLNTISGETTFASANSASNRIFVAKFNVKEDKVGEIKKCALNLITDICDSAVKNGEILDKSKECALDSTIIKMQNKIRSSFHKNSIRAIDFLEIKDGEITSIEYSKNLTLKCKFDYFGHYSRKSSQGHTGDCEGSIYLECVPLNDSFVVSKIDSFRLHLKRIY